MNSVALEKFKKETRDKTLFTFHGPFSPLLTGVPWSDPKESPVYIPMPLLFINKGRDTQVVINDDAYKGHAKEVFRKYLNNEIDLSALDDLFEKTYSEIKHLHDLIFDMEISTWSDSELVQMMDSASIYLWHLIARTLYMETFDRQIADAVIPNEYKEDLEIVWETAIHPKFESFEIRRRKQTKELIAKHGINDKSARMATFLYVDYFLPKSIQEIKRNLTNFELNSASVVDSSQNVEDKTFTENQRKLFEYVQFVMKMRDIRKDPIAWVQAVLAEIANEMIKRSGLKSESITTLSPLEYKKGIQWLKENKDDLEKGLEGVVLFIDDSGKILKEYMSPNSIRHDIDALLGLNKEVVEIKGQPASKGSNKGKVRIIIDPEGPEAAEFTQGDILVTSMTRPEFVPLMKKAGAIITNEGGVTCHAAIISRELGIPCVISTKIATKILKNGDIVEVLADKGLVKILERNEKI